MACGRAGCDKEPMDGRFYCSKSCARRDVDSPDEDSDTPSSPEQEISSTEEHGEASQPSSSEEMKAESESEDGLKLLNIAHNDRITIAKTIHELAKSNVSADNHSQKKNENPNLSGEFLGGRKIESDTESSGRIGMTGTVKSTALMKSDGDGGEIPLEDSRKQLTHLREGISQSRSLIRDCAKHTLDLMKSIGSDTERDGTLRDFRKINSVAGLAREVANLAKVELEAIKIAKDLRD